VLQIVESGATYDINLGRSQSFAGDYFHLSPDEGAGTFVTEDQTPCFCRGVMILTPAGEAPVERLRVGDRVVTMAGEEKPITWIGQGRRRITRPDSNARPVIVRRDALADGSPKRDLRLTRGHSLYLDGMLIPVEFLINGHSIRWDDVARAVEFYHVELAEHDVLIADGAPTESYREDGNRELFENPESPRFTTADTLWFAPVTTGGPRLDRIWRRLLDRSGFVESATTDDPDLHLVADGRRVDSFAVEHRTHGFQGLYRFRLRRPPEALCLASRSMVPQLMGINHDPRRVGVAVRSITVAGQGCTIYIDYDSPRFADGFNAPEPDAEHRWTTGEAIVPAGTFGLFEGGFELAIDIVCTAKYPLMATASPPEVSIAALSTEICHAAAIRETRPRRDADPVPAAGAQRLGRGLQRGAEGAAAAARG
jgi:hypothetical protein